MRGASRLRLVKLGAGGADELCADVSLDGGASIPPERIRDEWLALAETHPLEVIEDFALQFARALMSEDRKLKKAAVRLTQTPWSGRKTLRPAGGETNACEVVVDRKKVTVASEISGLRLLKSQDGALSELEVAARWTYGKAYRPGECREQVRQGLVDGLGGKELLKACPEIASLSLSRRQTACRPASAFGLTRAKKVFVPGAEPVGVETEEFSR
jgi:hypothetical protein